jgi:hypothetical protein
MLRTFKFNRVLSNTSLLSNCNLLDKKVRMNCLTTQLMVIKMRNKIRVQLHHCSGKKQTTLQTSKRRVMTLWVGVSPGLLKATSSRPANPSGEVPNKFYLQIQWLIFKITIKSAFSQER